MRATELNASEQPLPAASPARGRAPSPSSSSASVLVARVADPLHSLAMRRPRIMMIGAHLARRSGPLYCQAHSSGQYERGGGEAAPNSITRRRDGRWACRGQRRRPAREGGRASSRRRLALAGPVVAGGRGQLAQISNLMSSDGRMI